MHYDLSRFLNAQEEDYQIALSEIENGRKRSHWIWYIFPQIKGLGHSEMSEYYGIENLEEARAYLADPVLSERLMEISEALLDLDTDDPMEVMGWPDNMKLKSSMTLFDAASETSNLFQQVLEKYFQGKKDHRTLQMLGLE